MNRAPHTEFGQTRNAPVLVYLNGYPVGPGRWDETLWAERAEDWYALTASALAGKLVRVVDAAQWRRSPLVKASDQR